MSTDIVVFDAKPFDIESFNAANLSYGFRIRYLNSHLNVDTAALSRDIPVVCAFVNDKIDAKVAKVLEMNGTKLIALRSAGYNNINLKAAYRKIHVVRVPAYSPHAVAEHAVALMLTLNRKTHKAYYRMSDNNFNINGLLGFDLYRKTAGIIGTGKIGKILTEILNGFGMNKLPSYKRNLSHDKQGEYSNHEKGSHDHQHW